MIDNPYRPGTDQAKAWASGYRAANDEHARIAAGIIRFRNLKYARESAQ